VVKANGYGHGLERAMRGFADADGLALIEVDNAVAARTGLEEAHPAAGRFLRSADLHTMAGYDLQAAVHCNEQLAWLEAAQR
jgi:alanine racemase